MKKYFILLCCILPTLTCILFSVTAQTSVSKIKLTPYVNPFIGTGGHGHTFPGPTLPFGACQVGPDTRLSGWDGCSGYHYSDSIIYGFSHTHLSGTGCSDYGDILLMPINREISLDNYQYASKFSHQKEKANAGYYQVYLNDNNVSVALTSTLHGAIHKYTYDYAQNKYVVLDLKHRDEVLDSKMEKVDDYTLQGYRYSKAWAKNQKIFYRITFSRKIESIQYEPVKQKSQTTAIDLEKSLHCLIKFEDDDKKTPNLIARNLQVKVTISGVDEEGAEKNMKEEMLHWNFDQYKKAAENEWERELGKIKIDQAGNSAIKKLANTDKKQDGHFGNDSFINRRIVFYTALYHAMIHPSIYNDVDGRYRGRDDKIHNTEGKFNYYTVFSLWDTYRALHPLLAIIDKRRTNDFINTFIKQYEQGGRLPIWELSSNETNCMIGYHVVSVIWDAYNKGIRDYDAELAFKAMKSIATEQKDYSDVYGIQRLNGNAIEQCADADALESYTNFGYIRSDDAHESVSKTLEYAYNDWCIAQMANALNKKKDYEYYINRSHNWMNVYDPTTGFMRARKNGTLYEPFSPYTVDNNFTEANSWQYSFYVPHEMNNLIQLSGGKKKFEQKLDDLFSAKEKTEGREQADITGLIGQYAHGNEPSHHIAYLYNYVNNPGKAQIIINQILDKFYANNPDGLIGNEDCGQMSAWYVLASLGLYSICPGNNQYDINEPLFERAQLNNKLVLKKQVGNKSVSSSFYAVNQSNSLSHHAMLNSNSVTFTKTNTILNKKPEVKKERLSIANPFIVNGSRIFKNTQKIEIRSLKPSDQIYYRLKNGIPTKYSEPISIDNNEMISFYTIDAVNKLLISPTQTATFTKLPNDRKVILKSVYNKSYSAGGAEAMIDGIFGKLNWRAGDWQGYQGQDVEIIIAFDKPKDIKSISTNYLEDQNSWIFYPKSVSYYTSNDSVNWNLIETIPTHKSDHEEKVTISKFQASKFTAQHAKFVKIISHNFGPMPQWHEGRGNETFIFIDEIEVN